MKYFVENYKNINYPILKSYNDVWLRNSQLWWIHAIASYFTLESHNPAILVMPTWSWKTAVLNIIPYLLRSKRVLVLTSSIAVRWQIYEEFSKLLTLKKTWVFTSDIIPPNVFEITKKFKTKADIDELKKYNVVIWLPWILLNWFNSCWYKNNNLFDLILVDEAHHVPAKSWISIINFFSNSKKVFFTATPFRRDKKEIPWKIIYTYTISRSYLDKTFWDLEFISIDSKLDVDKLIAKKTEEVFNNDKKDNLDHSIMVRTESKDESKFIEEIYNKNTNLRLKRVDSSITYKKVKEIIENLKNKKLDWIICVDMLWEWFDFPNLKIAALHSPKKSLSNTIQFIWRFARTNAKNIWKAKFIAMKSDISIWKIKLFEEWAIWNDIFHNLNDTAVKNEKEDKELLNNIVSSNKDFSLYNLYPYWHIKIYKINTNINFNINKDKIKIIWHDIYDYSYDLDNNFWIIITTEKQKPKWVINNKDFNNITYHLIIVYFNSKNWHLFIHSSSLKTEAFYKEIIINFTTDDFYKIPKSEIHKVLLWIDNTEFFNIGMQNKNNTSWETYRILTWPSTEKIINPSDWRMYSNWHVFWKWDNKKWEKITIWYSSWSKVWTNTHFKIREFIDWCFIISNKIISNEKVKTNTWLDYLWTWRVVDNFPKNWYWINWNSETFLKNPDYFIVYKEESNWKKIEFSRCNFSDIDLLLTKKNFIKEGDTNAVFSLVINDINYDFWYSFTEHYKQISEEFIIYVSIDWKEELLKDYFNEYPLVFYLENFALLYNNNEFVEGTLFEDEMLFDVKQKINVYKNWKIEKIDKVEKFNWNNTDITKEFYDNVKFIKNIWDKDSVQEFLKNKLLEYNYDYILFDHRTWEIADFITLSKYNNQIFIELYHVKASWWKKAWDRVSDVYEVCMQAVKSEIFIKNKDVFINKIIDRISSWSILIKSIKIDLEKYLSEKLPINYDIIIVQPWIKKTNLSEKLSTSLASSDIMLKNLWYHNWLRVISS